MWTYFESICRTERQFQTPPSVNDNCCSRWSLTGLDGRAVEGHAAEQEQEQQPEHTLPAALHLHLHHPGRQAADSAVWSVSSLRGGQSPPNLPSAGHLWSAKTSSEPCGSVQPLCSSSQSRRPLFHLNLPSRLSVHVSCHLHDNSQPIRYNTITTVPQLIHSSITFTFSSQLQWPAPPLPPVPGVAHSYFTVNR